MYDYDILVIGSGPGGYVAGSYASQFGKKAAVIEKNLIGGCCLNTGCIPTKTILEAGNRYSHTIDSMDYGIKAENVAFSWNGFKKYSEAVRNDLRKGVSGLLRSRRCEVINGKASLIDPHTVQIGDERLTADYIILATGAHPIVPERYTEIKRVITSDTFWGLEEKPKSILIVGGGVIGCEIASALSRLGTKVTIIEQMADILHMFDTEAVKILRDELIHYDVDIFCDSTVTNICETVNGLRVFIGEKTIDCEYLLWSTGRKPEKIDTGEVRLELTDRGFVKVDGNYKTNINNIFCIGDANGKDMLAHTAISQAMSAVGHICTGNPVSVYPAVPQTVFTSPAIARIGVMESNNSAIGKVPYSAVGYSHVLKTEIGYFKILRDIETDTLIGAEIVGYNACELIHNLAPYINKKLSVDMFSDIIYAHPTLTEGIKLAVEASYIRSPQA